MTLAADATPVLIHDIADPWSRAARIALGEKKGGIDCSELSFEDWQRGVRAPQIMVGDGHQLVGGTLILEYINDAFAAPDMVGGHPLLRAEVRRLTELFGHQFWEDVTGPLYREKVEKPQARRAGLSFESVDSRAIKDATTKLTDYAQYIGALYDSRRWLAGDLFSIADAMAAAQISLLDLMAVVSWGELSTTAPEFKSWYARVKSRPAFRAILDDALPDIIKPSYYGDPDF